MAEGEAEPSAPEEATPPSERVVAAPVVPATTPFACTLGALLAAIVDLVAANATVPFGSFGLRVMHGLWDVGMLLALGLFFDAAVYGARRFVEPRSRLAFFGLFVAVSGAGMTWLLQRIFSRQADALLAGRVPWLLYGAFVVGAGVGLSLAFLLGRWLSAKRRLFVLGLLVSLVALVVNEMLYRDDYFEIHTAIVWAASVLAGTSMSRVVVPRITRPLALVLAVAVVIGLAPPPNAVRLALFRSPGGVGAWVFANLHWGVPSVDAPPDPSVDARWYAARTDAAPRPASGASVTKGPPIVVLITIDAVRADDILDPAHENRFPTLARMKREGVTFTRARSAGSQTAVSLSALFAGKYFSEMVWEKFGAGRSRFEYPAIDDTTRFVSLLDQGGVTTSKIVSLTFLKNEFGVAPGFAEEKVVTTGRRHARANEVTEPLLERLRKVGADEPLFLFAHLTEPHAPYDRGKSKGPLRERYRDEIAVADTHLGKIVKLLATRPFADRSLLIVSSDHGEAFGEHGTFEHTKTIYEELVRVPLIVWGASVVPRTVDTPVTLVDLGPTVLDIFGLETPDSSAGETLLPILAGREPALSRPILAEGRLRRAFYVGDLKVIVDLRRKTVEAFDLAKDPGELVNLWGTDRARVEPAIAALDAYFRGRQATKDGYEPIYKP